MSNNALPPELVSKMYYAVTDVTGVKCAKIAVDYADEVSLKSKRGASKWLGKYNELDREFQVIKHQRDELFEALKSKYDYLEEIAMLIPSDNWTEQFRTKWNSEMTNLEQLLKKHEDGKG